MDELLCWDLELPKMGEMTMKCKCGFLYLCGMKVLLIIICVVLAVAFWPYLIALPFAIVKAVYLMVSGRDNSPYWIERKEAKKHELSAKAEARRQKRRAFWRLPSSPKDFFR